MTAVTLLEQDERVMARYGWSAKPYEPTDRMAMLELMRTGYDDPAVRPEAFFTWQFFRNPDGEAVIWLATTGREVVGQYLVVPRRFAFNGREQLGALSAFTLTREDFRGKGIFILLARRVYASCRARGIRWIYGFPNPNSYTGFVRHLGFSELGRLRLFVFPRHGGRILAARFGQSSTLRRSAGLVGGAWRAVAGPCEWWHVRRTRHVHGWTVTTLADVDGRFDALQAQVQRSYPDRCVGVRDSRYLRWRYLEHPTRAYHLAALERDGTLGGFMVLRIAEIRGLRAGLIVDWFTDTVEPRLAALRLFAAYAVRYCRARDVDLIGVASPPGSLTARAMLSLGFLPTPSWIEWQPQRVIFRQFDAAEAGQRSGFGPWYLTFGDQDIV